MILNLKVVFDSVWCINQNFFQHSRFLHLISFLTPGKRCSTLIVTFSFINNIIWDEARRIKSITFTIFHSLNWFKKNATESFLFQSEMWSVSPTSQPRKKLKINLIYWLSYQRLPRRKKENYFPLKNEKYSLDLYSNSVQSSWSLQIDSKTNVLFVVFSLLSSSYFVRE